MLRSGENLNTLLGCESRTFDFQSIALSTTELLELLGIGAENSGIYKGDKGG